MCATPDRATTARFRARKATQRGYKVLRRHNATCSWQCNASLFWYRCGRNVDRHAARSIRGYTKTNHGLHCYLRRKDADNRVVDFYNLVVVAITVSPTDIIAVEGKRLEYRQIVVRALNISARSWKQAGLPATKGGAP